MLTTKNRDNRLRREVGMILASGVVDSLSEALMHVISKPLSKGFYIAPDTAIQTEQRRRKMGTTNFIQSLKSEHARQKWTDFFAAVDEIIAKFPALSRQDAVLHALAQSTAPHGFYLDFHEAIKILRR